MNSFNFNHGVQNSLDAKLAPIDTPTSSGTFQIRRMVSCKPGMKDYRLLGSESAQRYCPLEDPIVDETALSSAVSSNDDLGRPEITIHFTEDGGRRLRAATGDAASTFGVLVDDELVLVAVAREKLGPTMVISPMDSELSSRIQRIVATQQKKRKT